MPVRLQLLSNAGTYPYSNSYLSGTIVDMQASANAGYVFDYCSSLELDNHLVNPDPFADDVFLHSELTVEDVLVHFRTTTAINDLVDELRFLQLFLL